MFLFNKHDGIETITKVVHDTVHVEHPVVHDTIQLPSKRIPVMVHDTLVNTEYAIIEMGDTTFLDLPQMQAHYSAKQYDLWISGVECQLDSINLYNTTTTITKVVRPIRLGGFATVVYSKRPYAEVGACLALPSNLEVKAGYHLEDNNFTPFIGGTFTFDFVK